MPQIQVDQRKIHVLYLVKIINAKESRFHGSVVMMQETIDPNLAIWVRHRAGVLFIAFLLNYFGAIIFFNNLYNT